MNLMYGCYPLYCVHVNIMHYNHSCCVVRLVKGTILEGKNNKHFTDFIWKDGKIAKI